MFRLAFVSCLAVVLAPGSPVFASGETVIAGELGKKLDAAVQRATGGGFWGVVLVATKGKPVLSKGYGYADYGERPNTPDTLFEIASTSKSFTAAAVLTLVMKKKLDLDDTLADLFRNVPKDKVEITVCQLLSHTSGISPDTGVPYASPMSRDEFVDWILRQPLASRPGEKFAYANAAYALAAAVVEVVAKKPFETYVAEKLFRPAGMTDTGFVRDDSLDATRVTTRLSDLTPDATAIEWHYGWGYRGMGGVVTTANDLLLWDRALRAGKILDESASTEWHRAVMSSYALGWRVGTTSHGTRKAEHSGGVEGYTANLVRYLDDDRLIVVLSNGRSDIHAVTRALERVASPAPALRAVIDVGPHELNRWKAAEFPDTARWSFARTRDGVTATLHHRKTKHAIAVLDLPAGVARKLVGDVAELLDGARRLAGGGMGAGVYLSAYAPERGKVVIEDGLEILLRPRYEGGGPDGEIVDERITLVLCDTGRGQWPVMAKMDRETAEAFVAGLRKTLGD
jgi:CubicO group peptidase (beta-lactamase class C family)